MPEKANTPVAIEGRLSDPILHAALRLGLPIELNDETGTGLIYFGQPRNRSYPNPCMEFVDQCCKDIHAIPA